MQNKPNLLNAQMNVNKVLTKDYENECLCRRFKNKAKQTQFIPTEGGSNPISKGIPMLLCGALLRAGLLRTGDNFLFWLAVV